MMNALATGKVVFETKWFRVIEKFFSSPEPHYLIETNDFVSIVAVTTGGELLLVRQFRPAAGRETLELPSGHVEAGETPEAAARKELLEETGCVAETWELLGTASPCIGRYTNRLWCFFAGHARGAEGGAAVEPGIRVVRCREPLDVLLQRDEFSSSLSYTSLLMALVKGRLSLPQTKP